MAEICQPVGPRASSTGMPPAGGENESSILTTADVPETTASPALTHAGTSWAQSIGLAGPAKVFNRLTKPGVRSGRARKSDQLWSVSHQS